jgi:cbb3-type cytochrome oxidase maturation protein
MDILSILIPVSLFLGAVGLVAFVWTMKARQYDDPQGDASRILTKEWDDHPKPPQDGPRVPPESRP